MGTTLRWPARVAAAGTRIGPVTLVVDGRSTGVLLEDVSGNGARVNATLPLRLGYRVTLTHPRAGSIEADVVAVERGGCRLAFDRGDRAVGFALALIVAPMERPAAQRA